MFHPDWLILRILHKSFEIERPEGHWSEVVVHLYICVSTRDFVTYGMCHNSGFEHSIMPDFLSLTYGKFQSVWKKKGRAFIKEIPLKVHCKFTKGYKCKTPL